MNAYEKMMEMLLEDMEKMHQAFADAYEQAEVKDRLQVCQQYAQTVSGLGLMMSTMSMLKPRDYGNLTNFGFGLGN